MINATADEKARAQHILAELAVLVRKTGATCLKDSQQEAVENALLSVMIRDIYTPRERVEMVERIEQCQERKCAVSDGL